MSYIINQNVAKLIILVNILYLPIVYVYLIHERYLSLKDADDEQSNFAAELKNLDEGIKTIEKDFFKNNSGLF